MAVIKGFRSLVAALMVFKGDIEVSPLFRSTVQHKMDFKTSVVTTQQYHSYILR